jgi:hypothetical protein
MTFQIARPALETDAAAAIFELRLYVAGQTAKSIAAIANLKRIWRRTSPGSIGSRSST